MHFNRSDVNESSHSFFKHKMAILCINTTKSSMNESAIVVVDKILLK